MPEEPSESYDCVYVSPHLDDVAFSCAAKILSDRRTGRRVLVASVYSSPGPHSDRRASQTYASRRLEDEEAMHRLGADRLQLDRVDAPFRSRTYTSFVGLTQGWDRKDRHEIDHLARQLRALFERIGATEIYAPLGIGGHVDHRICHEATRRAVHGMPISTRVMFYEDRPAALVREALSLRLTELNWQATLPPSQLHQRTRDFFSDLFSSPYVKTSLGGPPERLRVMARGAMLLARTPSSSWWSEAVVYHFGGAVIETIQAIVGCYASQVQESFDSLEGWKRMTQQYHRRIGYPNRYVERLWMLPVKFEP